MDEDDENIPYDTDMTVSEALRLGYVTVTEKGVAHSMSSKKSSKKMRELTRSAYEASRTMKNMKEATVSLSKSFIEAGSAATEFQKKVSEVLIHSTIVDQGALQYTVPFYTNEEQSKNARLIVGGTE